MSASNCSPELIRQRIAELGEWFQNIRLDGVSTAPDHFLGDYPMVKWRRFAHAIPDVTARTVLDVGCNAGFHAIEMKRRGAARVLAVDHDDRYLAQARFAAEVSEVDIDVQRWSVYELARLRERFDVVLFLGVLYHLPYPLLALDILHEFVVGDVLVFQSMLRGSGEVRPFERDYPFEQVAHFDEPAYPRLCFIEHEYCGDQTNWWIPNRACAEAMLRAAGFRIESHPEEEVFICRRVETPEAARPRRKEMAQWLKR